MVEKVIEPLDALMAKLTVSKGNATDKENMDFFRKMNEMNTLETFKNLMVTIYESVNLPCKEQAQLLIFQSLYYCHLSKVLELKVTR